MNSLILRALTPSDAQLFFEAKERSSETDTPFHLGYQDGMTFSDYLRHLDEMERGVNLPSGYVPGSLYFGFVEGTIVGRLSLRHTLNSYLFNVGGHIGYMVHPQFRGLGYATEMLRQGLIYASKFHLDRVLLTCDHDNVASIRVIEKCGGQLEGKQNDKCRYWISLNPDLKLSMG